jgi:hypothetical protein
MSVFTYKMCWLFHGYLRVSYMIKLTDYISPCFMLKSPITGGYLAKKQHTCTEQSYPNVQWRIPNNSSWIPSGTKKKRGKNVRKSQDSNVDVPNETSMACAVRGPIPSPAVSWWNPKKIEWWFHHPNHSEWWFHNHKIDHLPSFMDDYHY